MLSGITYLTFPLRQVVFQTKVYHPGIDEEGSICVPILRDEVSPRISLGVYNIIASWRMFVDEFSCHVFRVTSGNHRSHCQPVSRVDLVAPPPCQHCTVLAVIQEKLNNPSADDPYEPDIAAVSSFSFLAPAVTTPIW